MIDIHAGRKRDVHTGFEYGSRTIGGDVLGYVQRPCVGAVIPDPLRGSANAERWHRPIEEPVVVVGREDDDQFGVEVRDEVTRRP